ncbi:MAG TPA: alpha/beta fold hydrolase [Anaerolineales bacterium]
MSTVISTSESQAIVKKVYRAFFGPSKYEVKSTDQAILARGNNTRIPFEGGELAVTTWGDGPAVLLMHGWGGARAQMTGFVDPLLAAGYRVVAYDQPAHGHSDGEGTNLLEIAPTMDLIALHDGSFHAIIAHSFGTLITSYALVNRNFPPPARLVYFGSFNRLMDSLPRFHALAQLPDEIIEGLRAMIYKNFGQEVLESITNEILTPQISIPALMFHDTMDNVTPIEDSRAVARAWKWAQLIETEGLGHRGALQSRTIHEQVVRFLKS